MEEAVEKAQPIIKLVMAQNVDRLYIGNVLPGKMKYNLSSSCFFRYYGEIATMFRTEFAVLGKKYVTNEVEKV